jgi:hypothetical protein
MLPPTRRTLQFLARWPPIVERLRNVQRFDEVLPRAV